MHTKELRVSSSFLVIDNKARIIANCLSIPEIPELSVTFEEATANAKLFAQAPKLLTSLKAIMNIMASEVNSKGKTLADDAWDAIRDSE